MQRDYGHYLNCAITRLMEKFTPVSIQNNIKFWCPAFLPLWRAETLFTKEPETIAWIDSFQPGELYWDIGANVGCYALYSASKSIQTVAFEPSAYNFFVLQKNIEINQLNEKLTAYCIALNDKSEFGKLVLSNEGIGGAENNFSESSTSKLTQGMVSYSVDDLISKFHFPSPDHIKIDVDGIEKLILVGAKSVLTSSVKSVLVEIDEASADKEIVSYLIDCGFIIENKNKSETLSNTPGSHIYNYIFKKEIKQ